MPKPPPRLSSASTSPVAWAIWPSRPTTRCAAASNPAVSKIWEPMWLCRPVSWSAGSRITRTAAVSASPVAREKPNFWSSCAVAMNSWVCASMPTVARISTGTGAPPAATRSAASGARGGQPVDLVEGVEDDVADARLDRQPELDQRLVVAVQRDPLGGEPGGQREGQLVAAARVQVQAVVGDPARDLAAEERLRRVVHVGALERGREVRRTTAEVSL